MPNDNLCALYQRQIVVRIGSRLVLSKEYRILQLANIVIQGARTHQLTLGHEVIGHLCSQIGHLHTMLEGAGSFF